MALTAKHMNKTAEILRTMVKPLLDDQSTDYSDIVSEFADMFEAENKAFDYDRFCAAAGIVETEVY